MIQLSEEITKIKGGVSSPKGFEAKGVHCGLRYSKKDLGAIISEAPAVSAAVYTQSHFQAAPLKVTQASLKKRVCFRRLSSTARLPTPVRETKD